MSAIGLPSATRDEVMRAFEEAEAAVAPIYDVADVLRDPQYAALESIISMPDEDLGQVKMQNVLFRMLGTPGQVRWPGRRLGQDNEAVFAELGVSPRAIGRAARGGRGVADARGRRCFTADPIVAVRAR